MAATSLTSHIATTTGRGKWSRASSARFRPVAMPTRADSAWNSIAIRLASTTTHNSW